MRMLQDLMALYKYSRNVAMAARDYFMTFYVLLEVAINIGSVRKKDDG
jgi:hypothetical protein